MTEAVRDHYEAGIQDQAGLLAKVTRAIDAIEPPLTAEKLAGFDQFHVGAMAATAELAKRAHITRAMHVLDAGSGLGGPSRFLAETIGCRVTGVDLTPAYVVMNIPERVPLYRELRRVLKTGGTFAFYDPYLPDTGDAPLYPVPWAETALSSTLLTKQTTVAALADAGFRMLTFDDITPMGVEWIARQQEQIRQVNAPTLATVMGERMREMAANLGRNLMEGRVRLVMGTCQAV
jgi:sarcosine/dimethylglycine N-methyltransferase